MNWAECPISDDVALAINCKCESTTTENDCKIGEYCWTDHTCNLQRVSEFNYIAGAWEDCSTTCGLGVQTRILTCSSENTLDCDGLFEPATSQECVLGGCGNPKIIIKYFYPRFFRDLSFSSSFFCFSGQLGKKVNSSLEVAHWKNFRLRWTFRTRNFLRMCFRWMW
jgi:hypothetical protein